MSMKPYDPLAAVSHRPRPLTGGGFSSVTLGYDSAERIRNSFDSCWQPPVRRARPPKARPEISDDDLISLGITPVELTWLRELEARVGMHYFSDSIGLIQL